MNRFAGSRIPWIAVALGGMALLTVAPAPGAPFGCIASSPNAAPGLPAASPSCTFTVPETAPGRVGGMGDWTVRIEKPPNPAPQRLVEGAIGAWWGIAHAWAPAALLEPRPIRPAFVTSGSAPAMRRVHQIAPDGTIVRTFFPEFMNNNFGATLAAADMNGDGTTDVVIGDDAADTGGLVDSGAVYVYSGLDGSLLYKGKGAGAGGRFGRALALVDFDGDGKLDLVVGCPGAGNGSGVLLFEKLDGTLVRVVVNPTPLAGDFFGDSVAARTVAGSLRIAVGAPGDDPAGRSNAGSTYEYDALGRLVRTVNGQTAGDGLGDATAVQADGTLLAGGKGHVIKAGAQTVRLAAPDPNAIVDSLDTGDFGGDDTDDVFGGQSDGNDGKGTAFVIDGATNQTLFQTQGAGGDHRLTDVEAVDVNGDGRDDLTGGAPGDDGAGADAGATLAFLAGPVRVYQGEPGEDPKIVDVPLVEGEKVTVTGEGQVFVAGAGGGC